MSVLCSIRKEYRKLWGAKINNLFRKAPQHVYKLTVLLCLRQKYAKSKKMLLTV